MPCLDGMPLYIKNGAQLSSVMVHVSTVTVVSGWDSFDGSIWHTVVCSVFGKLQ